MKFRAQGVVLGLTLLWAKAFCFPTLAEEAPPAPTQAVSDEQIQAWIAELGDERFSVREAAQSQLADLGFEAFDALSAAENHEDIEIASRARYLVALLRIEWSRPDDPPELKQVLDGYESLDESGRVTRIKQLATDAGPASVGALCRLARFEKSQVLSRQAALAVMEQKVASPPPPERQAAIRGNLGRSPRPAIQWLRAYLQTDDDLAEGARELRPLVDAELETLEQFPERTTPEIAGALLRYQTQLYDRLEDRPAAEAAMARLIAIERGDTDSLIRLVQWFAKRREWPAIDQVARRFESRFEQEPLLGYSLAQARLEQGQEALANSTADRAFAINSGDANAHFEVAQGLRQRGLIHWAMREYQHVIDLGPPENSNTLTAQFNLAEMMHDQGNDEKAAALLQTSLDVLEKAAKQGGNAAEAKRFLDAIRSHIRGRMRYYAAMHLANQSQHDQVREQLDLAIQDDPLDADVLIALYRLTDDPPDHRRQTDVLIESAIRQFRAQIAQNPRDPVAYNQLAWLLANTERQQKDALRLSQESLRLQPGEAGFLDTLARCHFALKDYDSAVKFQSQAVELDPNSGLMRRQLELFRKAQAEHAKSNPPPQTS